MTPRLVVSSDRDLHARLTRLALSRRIVLIAGLPGTGKSLVIHQITHLATDAGREVHLLQWDVARPVIEASEAGRRYPVIDGVTHAVIRKAMGLWSRHAIARWEREWPAREHLLVGETPFVGNRLIELARPMSDAAEPILTAASCGFAIPVPSVDVRQFLEAERDRRMASPRHPREREDAPPRVLRDLWSQLVEVARALAIPVASADAYDPDAYRRVYEALLRHRHVEVLPLQTVLPTAGFSAYDFDVPCRDLVPREVEASALVREVEALYPDPVALAHDIDRWWIV